MRPSWRTVLMLTPPALLLAGGCSSHRFELANERGREPAEFADAPTPVVPLVPAAPGYAAPTATVPAAPPYGLPPTAAPVVPAAPTYATAPPSPTVGQPIYPQPNVPSAGPVAPAMAYGVPQVTTIAPVLNLTPNPTPASPPSPGGSPLALPFGSLADRGVPASPVPATGFPPPNFGSPPATPNYAVGELPIPPAPVPEMPRTEDPALVDRIPLRDGPFVPRNDNPTPRPGPPGSTLQPLVTGPELIGRVVDDQGRPVASASIQVVERSRAGRRVAAELASAADGRFRVRNLQPGIQYDLVATTTRGPRLVGTTVAVPPDTAVIIQLNSTTANVGL